MTHTGQHQLAFAEAVGPSPRTVGARAHRYARLAQLGTWLVLGCMVTGCGYSADSLYRKNVRTVYVEMFHSKEFRRDIEFHLTEAVRKQIDRMTPYRNAPRERADTILTGEVLEWREATLGHDPMTALPRETAGTLAIRYRWQDLRTGALLVDQPRLITTVPYTRPTGETAHNAIDDAVNRIARKVVHGMETAW
ncbi:MAG: hypothetical protein GXY55_11705 [Phycisphaerae bacterium]|nr:hypothetical protein [Phycisphaerae bacterium]